MSKSDETVYMLTMLTAKKMLKENEITEKNYVEFKALMDKKYKVKINKIFADIYLL